MAGIRKTELNLIVGINGSGKTTFIADDILDRRTKNLIITPDPQEWESLPIISTSDEIRQLKTNARIIYESPETLENIKNNYSGGALVLDDAMVYLTAQTPVMMQYLYIRRRQYGVDLYVVAHGLKQLPPKVFTYASWLILFESSENFTGRKNDILPENYEKIIAAQEKIGKIVSSGKDPYYKEIILLDKQIRGIYVQQNKNN